MTSTDNPLSETTAAMPDNTSEGNPVIAPEISGLVGEIQSWYSDPDDRLLAAKTMVAAVTEAHKLSPSRWSITYRKDSSLLRLNVGVARIFDLAENSLLFAMDTTDLQDEDRKLLGDKLLTSEGLDKGTFGSNACVRGPAKEVAALFNTYLPAFRSLLAKAVLTSPLHQRHHDPQTIRALRELTQQDVPEPELAVADVPGYWKIAPGERAFDWKRCRDGGFIAMGWNNFGDISGLSRSQFDALVKKLNEKPGTQQLWTFRNIPVGSKIVANLGTSQVLGIGTVTGEYFYRKGEPQEHHLPVRWEDTTRRSVKMPGWVKTLVRLPEATFEQLKKAPGIEQEKTVVPEQAIPLGGIDFDGIVAHLQSRTLCFPPELVASYLLALQARRFVLLTGISGTGKTQLALEIAKLYAPDSTSRASAADSSDSVTIIAQMDHVKRGRFVVPSSLAKQTDALYDASIKRIDVRTPGNQAESTALYKDSARPGLMIAILSGVSKAWFQSNIKAGDPLILRRDVVGTTEQLVIEKPSEPVTVASSEPNYALIAVRPDWTDARALLGYYNPVLKQYSTTPTLNLLLRAQAELDRATKAGQSPVPYFLVYDEMNLARVEHYFSDFLSAMESGEPIHLHDDDDVAESADCPVPKKIPVPKNVFVVGTVNIDETTYMFSPKVLDRAFVLEFNYVDLLGLGTKSTDDDAILPPLALSRMGAGLRLLGRPDDEEWMRFRSALGGELFQRLQSIHQALSSENRHFGYRVAREVARFVDLAQQQTAGTAESLRAAFDIAVYSKILPKLHGGQSDLDASLSQLFAVAINDTKGDLASSLDSFRCEQDVLVGPDNQQQFPMPRSALKLWRMRKRLRSQGFVSFIE